MKAAKIVGIVFGGLLVLVAVVAIVALLPGVQTWAVRKVVADQPGMKIEVGRVAAGFSAAKIDQVRLEQNGMVITAKGVSADYSAWDYIAGNKINADQVTVEDLVVDLRAVPPAPAESGKAMPSAKGGAQPAQAKPVTPADEAKPFNGILGQAKLPFDVRVARLAAKGRALLPAEQTVVFDLQGSGIETGQRGKLEWKVEFTDPKTGAPMSALNITGSAGVRLAGDKRVDLIEVDALATARGRGLPSDQIKLEAKAEQLTAGANEGYTFALSLVRSGKVEPLVKGAGQFQVATRELSGAWDIAIRSEQLAAVLAGLGLPELAATGGGKFSYKADTGAIGASGDLQGTVSQLEKVAPELARIGSMQFRTTFDGGMADNAARLDRLQLDVTAADGRRIAQISTLQRIGFSLADKRVTLVDPKAELARISIQGLPLAWAQPFIKDLTIDSGDLSLALAVEAEADGSRVRARALEPIAIKSATVRSGDKKLVEQLSLSVSPRIEYTATRLVAELADLKVSTPAGDNVSGSLNADVTNLNTKPAIAFASQLQVRSVAVHRAYLPLDPGPLTVALSTEGKLEGDVLRVTKLSNQVARENGAQLAAVELLQPLTANLAASTFTVPNPAATLARIKLGEVPLAWAEAFVPKSKFDGALAGATLEVSARSATDLTINTTEPLVVRGATVTMDGKPMARALDLSANLTATKRGDVIAYEVRRVEVKQGETLLAGLVVAGEAKLGDKLTLTAKGNLEADAALLNQPAAASFATLSRGKFTTAFEATMADSIQAKAAISGKGLVAKQNNQPLGDLTVTLDAAVKPDGSGSIVAPVTLTNGTRRSDIALNGTFGKTSDQKAFLFAGKIASTQLFIADFQPLAALAPAEEKQPATVVRAPGAGPAPRSSTPAPAPAPAPKSTRDTEAFWAAVQGKVEVDMKHVVYGKDYTITGIRGNATITPSRLALDGLQGQFKNDPFKANAVVTFNPQQAQPYALTGTADLQNLDVGEILRASNPKEQPTFESKVTMQAKVNGNGGTVADLAKNIYGRLELTGTEGVTRILANKGGLGSTAVNVASLALAIAGAKNNSQSTTAASELVRFLNEVRFDSLKLQVERGQDLQLKISSIEMIAPFLRLTGSGTVANQPNVSVENQPMNIVLQLGAKGEFAHLLNRRNLLKAEPDDKGYQLMSRTFNVGGTAAKADSSALWKMLLAEGVGELLERFGR